MRKPSSPRKPGHASAREPSNGFARTLAREEFGRFYWNDALAGAVARQQAKTAERIEETRAKWKARARARSKAAHNELRRKIRAAQQAKARCAGVQSSQ